MWPAITLPYTNNRNLLFATPLIPQRSILPSGISQSLAHVVHFILPLGSSTYNSASLPKTLFRSCILSSSSHMIYKICESTAWHRISSNARFDYWQHVSVLISVFLVVLS